MTESNEQPNINIQPPPSDELIGQTRFPRLIRGELDRMVERIVEAHRDNLILAAGALGVSINVRLDQEPPEAA